MNRIINGKCVAITEPEITAIKNEFIRAELHEKTRPLTESEVSRLFIAQSINTVITDDATASRAVDFHPTLKQDSSLVSAGTRINWHGKLKRAAVDLWDTAENNPDNAPGLWEDIAYRDGFRIIPTTITAGTVFAKDEYGWWGDALYQSKIDSNVWTPDAHSDGWTAVEM